MAVEAEPPLAATYKGRLYVFCSEACRVRFLRSPERYASH
jgi:YHS domain-containing protein